MKRVCLIPILGIFTLVSCAINNSKPVTIWTNVAECVSFAEFFNQTHSSEKVILVYKENPSLAFESLKGVSPPDIIISSFLKTSRTRQLFRSVDSIFTEKNISQSSFYPSLLDAGKVKNTQYLLPLNFNLPVLIFSKDNSDFVQTDYTLSLEQVKQFGKEFNATNRAGNFTRIGFIPQHSKNFLYCTATLFNVNFSESKNLFSWSEGNLNSTILFLKNWTLDANKSSSTEQDFSYKYLSMPDYKQVASGKTLFAYTTSSSFFELTAEQTASLDYRWLSNEEGLPCEEDIVFIGIPKFARKKDEAYTFISWLLDVKTQTKIIEDKEKNTLNTSRFGIAGGFSSLKEINEYVLPLYKTNLLTNIPRSTSVFASESLPANWDEIKTQIIIPYLEAKIAEDEAEQNQSLEEKIQEWKKQRYN